MDVIVVRMGEAVALASGADQRHALANLRPSAVSEPYPISTMIVALARSGQLEHGQLVGC